jgi:hypothetical protein
MEKTIEKLALAKRDPDPTPKPDPPPTSSTAEALKMQGELDDLRKQVADNQAAQKAKHRKELLDAGAKAGKFMVADRPQWEKLYEKDPMLCETMLKTMQAVVPIGQRVGSGADGEEGTADQCEKIIRQIMKDESTPEKPVTYDVAFTKAYTRNRTLFERRDQEQLAIAKDYGQNVRMPG